MSPIARFLLNVITFKGFTACDHRRRVPVGVYGGEICVDCGAEFGDTDIKRVLTKEELEQRWQQRRADLRPGTSTCTSDGL
jgi:hypothetical protein